MRREPSIVDLLMQHGVTRRQFLKFCTAVAATLALPGQAAATIARQLALSPRVPVVWVEFQDCTGDTESLLRASPRPDPIVPGTEDPGIVDLLLDVLSVDYHETLMVPAGLMAEKSRQDTLANYAGQYLAIVEGSIPAGRKGAYCTIGGRTALSIVQEVCSQARATIALGNCAWDGGLAAAAPNPTGAVGVRDAIPGLGDLIGLPGCPANVVNLVATMVYPITYDKLPPRENGVPHFAYNEEIHEECERHEFYEREQFVRAWGDEGHRQGWCLRMMGCKGPDTDSNCPTVRWNGGTCWPVAAGHGCVGCASPHFWDRMTPFYAGGDDD
jgi:hydrogenase small subunit